MTSPKQRAHVDVARILDSVCSPACGSPGTTSRLKRAICYPRSSEWCGWQGQVTSQSSPQRSLVPPGAQQAPKSWPYRALGKYRARLPR